MAKNPKVEKQSARPVERRNRFVALGDCASGIGDRAIRKRGFAEPRIVAEWERIVGPDLAKLTRPARLAERTGALVIKVGDGATAMRLQHMTIQITERVNSYFGFRAVNRVQILQGVIPKPRRAPPPKAVPRALSEAETAEIDQATDAVPDDALKSALRRLGRAIVAERTKT
jgi:hypothetical protein